jgi:2,3-dihydroxybenzoate-AMP ligase
VHIEGRIVRWPHFFVERYRAAGAWKDELLGEMLRDSAARRPDATAVCDSDTRLTYAELDRDSDRCGAALLGIGLNPGDRMLFQVANAPESVVAYYGAVKVGLIPVCAIPQHGERDMLALAQQSGARAYLVQADVASQDLQALAARVCAAVDGMDTIVVTRGQPRTGHGFEALLAGQDASQARRAVDANAPQPQDVAAFQLSGGTTGAPKIIPRLHTEYACNSRAWAAACGWDEQTVLLHPIPLIHNAGIAGAMQPCHAVGGRLVLAPRPDIEVILKLIERERVQVIPVVPPAILLRLLDFERRDRYDLSSLTHLIVGGQQLPPALADRVEAELGIPCLQMFGMAEGMFLRTPDDAPEWIRKHTVGCPISELDEVRLLDPGTETEVPVGGIGELCCRGPYTIRGYFDAPVHNARAFTSDGFYRTGDLARAHLIDGVTAYSVEGRIKDVINRGAEKINAGEIEDVLIMHPRIGSAAVVAMPDPVLGERACAYITPAGDSGDPTLEDIVPFLLGEGLAKFKLPERLQVVDVLPLANVGKVDKKALRADITRRLEQETQLVSAECTA